MAYQRTATERAADKALLDAVKTFLASYNQTKLAGDVGTWDFNRAVKLFARRAVKFSLRGNIGFSGDMPSTLP